MQKTFNQIILFLLMGVTLVVSLDAGEKDTAIPESDVIKVSYYDNSLYLGIGVGMMKLKDDYTQEYFKTYPLLLQLGYQITPYLAIEGRYIRDIGNVEYENGITLSPDNNDFPTIFSNKAIYFKLLYPVNDFSFYTLLGYGEVSLTDIRGADRAEHGFQWGVGLAYKISENNSIFIDYCKLYEGNGFDGRAKIVNTHVDFVVIGVSYAF